MVATKTGHMIVTEKEMAKVVLAVMAKAVVVQWIRMTAPWPSLGTGLHPIFLPSILVVCTVQLEALSANDLSAV